MQTLAVGDEGEIVIPESFRAALGLEDSSLVSIEVAGNALVLTRARLGCEGIVAFYRDLTRKVPLTPHQEREAFGNGIAADFAREQAEGRYG